jgi:hypothetical protein
METNTTWARRALVATAIVVAVPVPMCLASASTTGSVAGDVAAYLAGYPGSHVTADNSSATQCIGGPSPQPIAYRNDRIVIRAAAGMSDAAAQQVVNNTLSAHGRPDVHAGPVERITFPQPTVGEPVADVLSVTLTHSSGEAAPVVALARWLNAGGTTSALDYTLSPTSGPVGMWPMGPPVPAPASALPAPRTSGTSPIGSGVTIWLYDTGQAPPSQSNPSPNVSRLTTSDIETLDANKDGTVDLYYGGHSIEIGGVEQVLASGATVKLAKITEANGIATDFSAAREMATTLKQANKAHAWPNLIVAPFGSAACDLDPTHPGDEMAPLGLAAVSDAVDRIDKALVVASSGNRGESRRFYPAAFEPVLAVGALDTASGDPDGNAWSSATRAAPVATFSNFGSWVDWWAPGVDLVTNSVVGLRYEAGAQPIMGFAKVAGTSFSAPYAAAMIAEQMAASGQTVDVARTSIENSAVTCLAHGGYAVALTTVSATATTRAVNSTSSAC